VKFNS